MKTKKRSFSLRHSLSNGKTNKSIGYKTTKKNVNITFAQPFIREFSIELKDKEHINYKWKVNKSRNEEIFIHKYPLNLLLECNSKLHVFIRKIAKDIKVHISNIESLPETVLIKLKESFDNVYAYTLLRSELRTEFHQQIIYGYLNNKYNKLNASTKILMHRFIYHAITTHYYYINDVYNLLPINFNKDFKILNICHHLGYTEACIYKYINKTDLENINSTIESHIISFVYGNKFNDIEIKLHNRIYKYNNYKLVQKIWSPEEIDNNITQLQSSKDLCFLDVHMFLKPYKYIRINYNHQLLLGGLILAMCSLKQNGTMLLSIAGLSTKFSQDLLFIVGQYFDRVILFKTEIFKPHYDTYFVACYGFRNKAIDNFSRDIEMMKAIYKEMYDLDNTGGLAYKPNAPAIEKELGIAHTKSGYTYFNSLLDNNGSVIYDLINSHIEERLHDYSQFLDNVNFYYDNIRRNKELHTQYQLLNYYKSIQMANYLGLKINPAVNVYKLKTDITTDIYQNLYGFDTTVYYKFRMYPGKFAYGKPTLQSSNQILLEQILKMHSATRIFDTRNIDNYDYIKKKLRFYEHSLNKILMDRFNTGIPTKNNKVIRQPSRAWIKMYEIAEVTQLITNGTDKTKPYKALCFCEAPGNFILAINHYIKTKTDIPGFNWTAQSYNPNTQSGRDYHVLGDDYDLMKKYPEHWDFGPKNTGDVTDPDNIKYYGSVYNDVDLLTADCGTDWSGDDILSSKLMYGQLLFILNNLPIGKNFVIKYYIPFIHYPAQLAMFYIIYQVFGEISFYKPLQNAWSHEFYLIGKDYKGIDAGLLSKLVEILENYNPYLSPININRIPDTFFKQLEKVTRDIVDRFVFYIERYIYYLDIIEEGTNPRFDIIEEHINLRNEEWIKTFKIQKIKTTDKIA